MSPKDYMRVQVALINIGQQLGSLPLDEFLTAIKKAEATAPIIDPTLYRRGQANLTAIKRFAQFLNMAKVDFEALRMTMLKTAVDGHQAKMDANKPLPSDIEV